MALSDTEPESAGVPFSNPMVKSEVDEMLGSIGGMTRLVMIGSSSASPSASAPSPQSQHSSPPAPVAEIPLPYIQLQESTLNSTWQYSSPYIQSNSSSGLSAPIEITYSPTVEMEQSSNSGGSIQPRDMRLFYEQHHLGPDLQQQFHPHQAVTHEISPVMGMGHIHPTPQTQQYYATLIGNGFAGLYQHQLFNDHNGSHMHLPNNIQGMAHNPQESWQTLEAQYKP